VLLVIGGVFVGVAVAGVPSRRQDPPLRADAAVTSTTSTTLVATTSTTAAAPSP
jgi:hypothetical protein